MTTLVERSLAVWGAGLLALVALGCGAATESTAEVQSTEAPQDRPAKPSAADVEAAVRQLQREVEQRPDDPQVRHTLAVALHRIGRRRDALGHFEKLAELKPDTRHLIELGVAYASVQRPEEAEATFRRALETAPDHAVALHHLGNLVWTRGETREAISLYRRAVASDPDYLMAHFHLAEALLKAEQHKEAYRHFEKVVGLEPEARLEMQAFDASLLNLGILDLQMGAPERAVGFLELLVEAVPDHGSAHLLLSRALAQLSREEESRRQLEIHRRLAASRGESPPAGDEPGTSQGD